jgi:hypothetical protein
MIVIECLLWYLFEIPQCLAERFEVRYSTYARVQILQAKPQQVRILIQARLHLSHYRVLLPVTDTPKRFEVQSNLFGHWLDTGQHSAVHQVLSRSYGVPWSTSRHAKYALTGVSWVGTLID